MRTEGGIMKGLVYVGHRMAAIHRWEKTKNPALHERAEAWRRQMGLPSKPSSVRQRPVMESPREATPLTTLVSTRQLHALARATGRSVREVSIEMT